MNTLKRLGGALLGAFVIGVLPMVFLYGRSPGGATVWLFYGSLLGGLLGFVWVDRRIRHPQPPSSRKLTARSRIDETAERHRRQHRRDS